MSFIVSQTSFSHWEKVRRGENLETGFLSSSLQVVQINHLKLINLKLIDQLEAVISSLEAHPYSPSPRIRSTEGVVMDGPVVEDNHCSPFFLAQTTDTYPNFI